MNETGEADQPTLARQPCADTSRPRVADQNMTPSSYFGLRKRAFDLFVVGSASLLLLPFFLILVITIPLIILADDGRPLLFRQRRFGYHRRPLDILKFRTMVRGAAKQGPEWTLENDSRMTRAGRLLRPTALDELPQLLNIIKGEMSLVGPRALSEREFEAIEQEIPEFGQRLLVPPGLTGIAQVSGGRDDNVQKLSHDLEYIANASAWLDVKILLSSVRKTALRSWESR